MYRERIEALKREMTEMISLAKEEQRALTPEEQERASQAKTEIEALRKSLELDTLAGEWMEAEKAEIRSQRVVADKVEDPQDDKAIRESLVNYIKRGQVEGTNSYGGYTVPTRLYDWIVAKRDAESYMRQICPVITISGPTSIPTESTDLTAYWVAEGGSYTDSTQEFSSASLTPYKLTALDTISEELIEDSAFDIVGYLVEKIGRILGQTAETAYIKGSTLNNEPNGILSSSVTTIRTASATAVTADEIIGLFYALPAQYQRNASWLISGGLASKLASLTTGTGGIFAWGSNLANGAPASLMGRPCYISKDLDPVTANKNIAVLGDFSYYMIGDVRGIQIQRLNELYATAGKVGLRFTWRTGGVCLNTDAFRVLGTKTS